MSLEQIATLAAIAGGFVTIWWRLQQAIAETARFRATMEERLRGMDRRLESLGNSAVALDGKMDEHEKECAAHRRSVQAAMSQISERIVRLEVETHHEHDR